MALAGDTLEQLKRDAALAAVEHVRSGMCVGLGTGTTSRYAIEALGEKLRRGELDDIVGVPTSRQAENLALACGIPLCALDDVSHLDLAIDGADEVDPACDLIKGGGGALRREKVVELRSRRFIVIVDHTKLVSKLGIQFALPVEVNRNDSERERQALEQFGCTAVLREGKQGLFVTDGGNFIVDCRFPNGISDPYLLAEQLEERPNICAHGLFLKMASLVIVAAEGGLRTMEPADVTSRA